MPSLMIHDLPQNRDLDSKRMSTIRGGSSWLEGLGPAANVKVDVNQSIVQLQDIDVNALNNVGVVGAGFGPLRLNVSPKQKASAQASF